MELKTQTHGEVMVVAIRGELDGQTTPIAQAEIMPLCLPGHKLLLDMHEVTYMSSMGLQLLLLVYHEMAREKGDVALVGLNDSIQETLTMMGFLPQMQTYATREAGLAAMGVQASNE